MTIYEMVDKRQQEVNASGKGAALREWCRRFFGDEAFNDAGSWSCGGRNFHPCVNEDSTVRCFVDWEPDKSVFRVDTRPTLGDSWTEAEGYEYDWATCSDDMATEISIFEEAVERVINNHPNPIVGV